MNIRLSSHRRRVWLALLAVIVFTSANMIPIGLVIPAGEHPRVTLPAAKCPRAKQPAPAKASRYTDKSSYGIFRWLI